MLRAFGEYKSGFLPEPGGMLDQSAAFVEAVPFLSRLVRHHQDIDLKRARNGGG